MAADALVRSTHLSFFRRGPAIYVYHDLIGEIIEMSRGVLDLLLAFGQPRPGADVARDFEGRLGPGKAAAFIATLAARRCLVPAGEDEVAAALERFPVVGRWSVFEAPPDGAVVLYVPLRPAEGGAEGPGAPAAEVRRIELDAFASRLFRRIDGERTLGRLLYEAAADEADEAAARERAIAALLSLTHSDVGFVKLAPRSRSALEAAPRSRPAWLDSTMPYPRFDPLAPERAATDGADLEHYHRRRIRGAERQFEEVESTLSHLLGRRCASLGGRSYGEALADRLFAEGALARGGRILEVGGGGGLVARAFLGRLEEGGGERWGRARHVSLDLSPALLRAQREALQPFRPRILSLFGRALDLPIRSASVDLLLANEMIGDLETVEVPGPAPGGEGSEGSAGAAPVAPPEGMDAAAAARVRAGRAAIERYGLAPGPAGGRRGLNLGAIRLVEEAARILRPGGLGLLTEFGDLLRYPIRSTHLDHDEWSIRFEDLRQVAAALGLAPRLEPLPELIGLSGAEEVLATTRHSFVALRALLAERGLRLEKRLTTRGELEALCRGVVDLASVGGLAFAPASERICGLIPGEFWALLLRQAG